jgi:hypothetical protein
MTETLNKLQVLPVNKTVVFYSPIEGEDVLVRTGVILDDSFFHCLVHCISKEYIIMKEEEKNDVVYKLKKNIFSNNYTETQYNDLILEFEKKIIFILENFYKFINSENDAKGTTTKKVIKNVIGSDKSKFEYFNVIFQLISLESFKNIISKTFSKCKNKHLEEYQEVFLNQVLKHYISIKEIKYLEKDIKDSIQLLLEQLVYEICKESYKVVNKSFVDSMISNITLSQENIKLISNHLERDIYFIDSITRLPVNLHCENNKKCVIIMNIKEDDIQRYEIVGKLLPGNRVQREFSYEDDIIKKMHEFLCNPEKISESYPELSEYIADKKEKVKSRSRSRSRSSSRSHYKSPEKSPEDYDDDEEIDVGTI